MSAPIPAPRRSDVAIYTGPGFEPLSPHEIERRGRGGAETAALRLAQHLSQLGYLVSVYGALAEGAYRDVILRHHCVFDPMERRETVICSRIPELFERRVNARVRMLWLNDSDCRDRLTPAGASPIDHVLVASRFQAAHVGGLYPFLRGKLRRIGTGIEQAHFEGEPLRRRRRVLYTSSPDRGLDKLLELWPEIRERVPNAELAWANCAVYERVAAQRPEIAAHRELITKLSEQAGVSGLGSLSEPELARVMRSSLVWAHPSWATPYGGPFHESGCSGAVEAQAAGCLVVASNWGALPEAVKVGRLVDSEPLGERWRRAFVEEIVDGLTNEEVQAWAQERGPEVTAELGWDGVARQVGGLIEGEAFAFAGSAQPKMEVSA